MSAPALRHAGSDVHPGLTRRSSTAPYRGVGGFRRGLAGPLHFQARRAAVLNSHPVVRLFLLLGFLKDQRQSARQAIDFFCFIGAK